MDNVKGQYGNKRKTTVHMRCVLKDSFINEIVGRRTNTARGSLREGAVELMRD